MKSLKSILVESNRYNDVVSILTAIINNCSKDYPLHHPFIDENSITHWRADGEKVREQAKILLDRIEEESCGNTDDKFIDLGGYIQSVCEIYLINYAVAASHNKEPEHGLEIIRQWEVLRSLIDCWNLNYDEDWSIPESWKGSV